jgi:hypothetical protein
LIYLYIKTHQITGLKYFGKTIQSDPHKYKGSGTRWMRHLKKHGNHVDTEILGFYNSDKVAAVALKFSTDNNIVESKDWANLAPENGLDGSYMTEEIKAKISATMTGVPKSETARANIRKAQVGKKVSDEARKKMSESSKGQVAWNKGLKGAQVAWNKGLTKADY